MRIASETERISLVGGSVEVISEGMAEENFGVDNRGGQQCFLLS